MATPRILLSNDDGIRAAGIQALSDALDDVGEVWVSAPDRERSAASHSISLHKPLRAQEVGPRQFAVDGTPADCVYLAVHHLMDGPPDLVVSGINHGPNLGNDVLYSGTVSAAMEGALFGYGAIAISLCMADFGDGGDGRTRFGYAAQVARQLAVATLRRPMPPGVVLNVNVPDRPESELQGLKLCRLGYTDWADAVTERQDPRGRPYYWIGGDRTGHDAIAGSDNNATAAGYVTVTPIHYDLTDRRSFGYWRSLRDEGLSLVDDALGDGPLPRPAHPRLDAQRKPS